MRRIAFAGGVAAALFTGVSAQAVELRLAHSSQETLESELHTAAWTFQKYMQDFGPDLAVTIYPNNQLGQEREVYEAMQLVSGADCAISGTAILGNFDQRIGVIEVVAWLNSWGYRNVATNKPVEAIADLQGLKIRTIPTDTYVEAVNAMGANATPMAFGEIYTAMETGVLDGLEHSAAMVLANKFYEVADHYTLTRHLYGPMVFACSTSFMATLNYEQRATLVEAASFASDVQRALALAPVRESEAIAALAEAGMVVQEIDVSSIQTEAGTVQDALAEKLGATEILAKIRTAGAD